MLSQARGMVAVSKQLKICYLVSEQLKNTSLFVSSKKTFSQLVGTVMSPANNPLHFQELFHFSSTGLQYYQISLKRIIPYKSSLTDALICVPQFVTQ